MGRRKWRFGSWATLLAALIAFWVCVAGMLMCSALTNERSGDRVTPIVVAMASIVLAGITARFWSRNYVEIADGNIRVFVAGEQINSSNDIVFVLPPAAGPLPEAVRCIVQGQSVRLPLLGQNKFWTPTAMGHFTEALADNGVSWRWKDDPP